MQQDGPTSSLTKKLKSSILQTPRWKFLSTPPESARAPGKRKNCLFPTILLMASLGLRFAAEERTGGSMVGFWQGKLAQTLLGQRRFEDALAAASEALAVLRGGAAVKSSLQIVQTQTVLMQAFFGLERWADADRLRNKGRPLIHK